MSLSSRIYAGVQDLQSMLNLLLDVRPADRLTDFPSPVDLREALALKSVQDNTRLWFDAYGQIVGFAYVDPYCNLRFEFGQQVEHPEVALEILNWGETCIRRLMQERGEILTLDASCRDDDTQRIAWLERYGFVREDGRTLHMVRPLDAPIATPQVPAGFDLRHVAAEREAEALVALHRAAFGTEQMTLEERLAMMHAPDYDPELDLLMVAPDGRFAAYCMCSISQEENARTGRNQGYTDPVATHPDFQRRGLAKALLLTGLRKLKQRGMDTAVLGTYSENIAMQRAAKVVGFYVQSATLWFSRRVAQE